MIGGVSIWMSINPDIQYNSVKLDISDMEKDLGKTYFYMYEKVFKRNYCLGS